MRALRRAHSRFRRGYTAVEVLSALTLFAIGAAGVIGMQRVTIQGGTDARRFDIANNIANEWLSRLQRDAMFWTLPSANLPSTSNHATATKWLGAVGGPCAAAFCIPGGSVPSAGSEGGNSPAFDVIGRDMPKYGGANTGTDHFFCVQYRLQWIADPRNPAQCSATGDPCLTALMRAEVRVFWPRLEYGAIPDCEAPPVTPDSAAGQTRYHFVYATSAIRENASP